ncbi:MAG: bifunctional metallophosphatase/5'-nucleotidase, partial [Paracoccaceae bacterium]
DRTFRIAMTTYLALGSFGERWNGLPLSGGIPGEVPGFDLRPFPRQHTGLVYRNVLVDHIRRLGRIDAALDGRLQLG